MAVVNIKKASILALKKDKDAVIEALQTLGEFEPINLKEQISQEEFEKTFSRQTPDKEKSETAAKINETKFALDFLTRYDKSKKPLFAEKPEFTEEQLFKLSKKLTWLKRLKP